MIAIDTNILVRFLTNDHPEQSPRARALLEGHEVFVGPHRSLVLPLFRRTLRQLRFELR